MMGVHIVAAGERIAFGLPSARRMRAPRNRASAFRERPLPRAEAGRSEGWKRDEYR